MAISFGSAAAQGSDWVKVATSSAGDTHYVDVDSIRIRDGMVTAWVMRLLAQPDRFEDSSSPYSLNNPWATPSQKVIGPRIWSYKSMYSFNCKEQSMAMLQLTAYSDPEGITPISTQSLSKRNISYEYTSPDSIGETQLNFVCRSVTQQSPKSK